MLKEWLLAIRCLKRECRAGQWLVIFFALVFAVATITTINFFTNRLQNGLAQQNASLLGGDLVITSSTPAPEAWLKKTAELSIRTAEVLSFSSVISAHNQLQLVNVQAVPVNYPLYGEKLSIEPHNILVEPRLLSLLTLKLGDNISIGAAKFKLEDASPASLDLINTGWVIAPTVVMRSDDVPATKVVIPGSRVSYRLLMAGKKADIQTFISWVSPQLQPGQRILSIEEQRFMLLNSLQHADKYIQLVVLFTLLMCGTAITLSVRQHLHRHYEDVALWRCLGSPEHQVTGVYIRQLVMVACAAGAIGTLAGFYLHTFIINIFYSMMPMQLPPPNMMPLLLGFTTSTLMLFCYAYPIITTLPRTSPLYLWRHDTSKQNPHKNLNAIMTLVLLLAYVYWMMDFSLVALLILDSLLLSVGFLYLLNILTFSFLRKLVKHSNGVVHRGVSQLLQHPETAGIQLTAFTLLLMSVLILSTVKNNLLDNWQASLPSNTPNYFAFNISPAEKQRVPDFLAAQKIQVDNMYPMIRGRLITLNGKPIMEVIPPGARGHNALHRDLNLSSMLAYPSDNKIESGRTWSENDKGKLLVSIESKLARDMQLKIGDQLGFQIGDRQLNAEVSNIRSVDWSSFHPNFFIIFPPETLNNFPTTYLSSFHMSSTQSVVLNQLVKQFPNVTVIDIASTLRQIQELLAKTATALQYLFSFAVCAAALIFITSLTASMDERKRTYRLLRVLGASRNYIINSLVVEFSFLAILTILFAYGLSQIISRLLITMLF